MERDAGGRGVGRGVRGAEGAPSSTWSSSWCRTRPSCWCSCTRRRCRCCRSTRRSTPAGGEGASRVAAGGAKPGSTGQRGGVERLGRAGPCQRSTLVGLVDALIVAVLHDHARRGRRPERRRRHQRRQRRGGRPSRAWCRQPAWRGRSIKAKGLGAALCVRAQGRDGGTSPGRRKRPPCRCPSRWTRWESSLRKRPCRWRPRRAAPRERRWTGCTPRRSAEQPRQATRSLRSAREADR